MKYIIVLYVILSVCHIKAAEKKVQAWWYNATNRPIITHETTERSLQNSTVRSFTKRYTIEPKELKVVQDIVYPEDQIFKYYYRDSKAHERQGKIYLKNHKRRGHEFVLIFEPSYLSDDDIIVRYLAKNEFDEKYAKALKETQQKKSTEIHTILPELPKGVCGIVSEYCIEKPEKL